MPESAAACRTCHLAALVCHSPGLGFGALALWHLGIRSENCGFSSEVISVNFGFLRFSFGASASSADVCFTLDFSSAAPGTQLLGLQLYL